MNSGKIRPDSVTVRGLGCTSMVDTIYFFILSPSFYFLMWSEYSVKLTRTLLNFIQFWRENSTDIKENVCANLGVKIQIRFSSFWRENSSDT